MGRVQWERINVKPFAMNCIKLILCKHILYVSHRKVRLGYAGMYELSQSISLAYDYKFMKE